MKLFRILCVLALALCVTASVYAETQSVKVSGDLTVRGIFRDQYDLHSADNESIDIPGSTAAVKNGTESSTFMSVAALQVDADLTDNVTTVIRILNQRDWNVKTPSNTTLSGLQPTDNTSEFDMMVDLAYVQLKNFIYCPLTLTVGRQNLWFGKGFIVGANQQNPGANAIAQGNQITNRVANTYGNLSAPEYTAINSFDAVKAVLDYDPWTITAIYSNISNGDIQSSNDDATDLWGVNVGYKFCKYNGEAEGYWFYKKDELAKLMNIKDGNDVWTVGARGSMDPISWVTLAAEGAYQGGEYIGNALQTASRQRSAWALDASGEVRYFTDKFCWKPKLGVEYIYYSGDKNEEDNDSNNVGGTYTGWDPMYRGKYDSAIREFVGKFYQTARYPTNLSQTQTSADASYTNQHQVIFSGSVQPMDSLTLKANFNLFWNQYDYTSNAKSGGWVGDEVDLSANWDYTEDVSFGILAGWFMPGEVYYDQNKAPATDLVGTMKVSF